MTRVVMLPWLREVHREVYIGIYPAIGWREIVPRQLKVCYFDLEIYRSGIERFIRGKNEYLVFGRFRVYSGVPLGRLTPSATFGHDR